MSNATHKTNGIYYNPSKQRAKNTSRKEAQSERIHKMTTTCEEIKFAVLECHMVRSFCLLNNV